MSGISLDAQPGGTSARKIKFIDTTGYTIAQLEDAYNTNYGAKGWRIIQVVAIGENNYVVAEREV